jgi:tRNA(Ile)-lysidine synthase
MQSTSEIDDPDENATDSLPKAVPFVRPLLLVHRQQVESFLKELGQEFRTDASNQDTRLTRNRIRHELLPLLEREFNPQVRQALLRLGQQSREILTDETELAKQVLYEALIECTPRLCRLLSGPFKNQPSHRIRECFVVLWKRQDWPRQHMGFRDWNRLVELLLQVEGAITLPGQIQARCIGGELTIQSMKLRLALVVTRIIGFPSERQAERVARRHPADGNQGLATCSNGMLEMGWLLL